MLSATLSRHLWNFFVQELVNHLLPAFQTAISLNFAPSEIENCAKCNKAEGSTAGGPLKDCAKCFSVKYCNRKCQRSDWKKHKEDCSCLADERAALAREEADLAREKASRAGESGKADADQPSTDAQLKQVRLESVRKDETENWRRGVQSDGPHEDPREAIRRNVYLHDRPEQETFELLVDIARLRQADAMKTGEAIEKGGIYEGDGRGGTSKVFFERFLYEVSKKNRGFLPAWLTRAKQREYLRWATRDDHQFSLAKVIQPSTVQAAWDDVSMADKLRLIGDRVFGRLVRRDSAQKSLEEANLDKLRSMGRRVRARRGPLTGQEMMDLYGIMRSMAV